MLKIYVLLLKGNLFRLVWRWKIHSCSSQVNLYNLKNLILWIIMKISLYCIISLHVFLIKHREKKSKSDNFIMFSCKICCVTNYFSTIMTWQLLSKVAVNSTQCFTCSYSLSEREHRILRKLHHSKFYFAKNQFLNSFFTVKIYQEVMSTTESAKECDVILDFYQKFCLHWTIRYTFNNCTLPNVQQVKRTLNYLKISILYFTDGFKSFQRIIKQNEK